MSENSKGLLGSHESRMELAAVFGLVQQRQQINLQKSSIAEQQYTNFLLEQQVAFQNSQEQQRQKEKLLDLWCRELEHQGMSPLKASGQASVELEIQNIIHGASSILAQYSVDFEKAHESAVAPIVHSKAQQFMWANIAGAFSMVFAIPTATIWLGAIGVALFCIAYFVNESKKNIKEEELLLAEQVRLTNRAQENLVPYESALEQLPKSRLFDDKQARKILKDFMSVDFNNVGE